MEFASKSKLMLIIYVWVKGFVVAIYLPLQVGHCQRKFSTQANILSIQTSLIVVINTFKQKMNRTDRLLTEKTTTRHSFTHAGEKKTEWSRKSCMLM